MSNRSYFMLLDPDDSGTTYNSVNQTIEYQLILVELKIPDKAECSVLDWFHHLYSFSNPSEFLKISLGMDEVRGLTGTYTRDEDDDDDNDVKIPPAIEEVRTWDLFSTWIKNNLYVERHVNVSSNAVVVGDTSEFDIEYAFFNIAALPAGELDPLLGQWLAFNEENGTATLKESKVLYSAYL